MKRTSFGHSGTLVRAAAFITLLLVTSMLAAAPAGARPGGVGGCIAANADKSVIGVVVQQEAASATVRELIGQSCLSRPDATHVRIGITWRGPGRILEGSMTSVLYNCTTNKWAGSPRSRKHVRLDYAYGSKHNYGRKPSALFTVTRGHKYKVRLEGRGSYKRPSYGAAGARGHFYPSSADPNVPKWVGWSSCG